MLAFDKCMHHIFLEAFSISMKNNLSNTKLAFIGCGVMAESMIKGLVRKELVDAKNISASHPRESRREKLNEKYGCLLYTSPSPRD